MTTAAPPRTTTTTASTTTTINNDTTDHDRDTALLADYWDPALSLFDICARNNISLPDLDAWCHRPDIVEALDLTARMDAERSRRLVALAQSQAAGALVRATAANSPETARRAASALTRLNHQANRSAAPSREQQQQQQQSQSPDHSPNQPRPDAPTQAPPRFTAPASAHSSTPAAHLIAQSGTAPSPSRSTPPTLEADIAEARERLRTQRPPRQRAAAA